MNEQDMMCVWVVVGCLRLGVGGEKVVIWWGKYSGVVAAEQLIFHV